LKPSGRNQLPFRTQRGAAHLHRFGERAIAEFLAEIGHECGCTDAITDRLGAWRAIEAETLRRVGGDRQPVQLRLVPRDVMEAR
jgi:hypothetical protein